MRGALRKMCGPKTGDVTGSWRKWQGKELHELHSSPRNIRVIKSKRIRRAGHVLRIKENVNMYRILIGKPEGNKNGKDLDADGRIIFKLNLKKYGLE